MEVYLVTYANTNDRLYAVSCVHTDLRSAENDIVGCARSIIDDEHLDCTADEFMKEHAKVLSDGRSKQIVYQGEYEYFAQLMVTEI